MFSLWSAKNIWIYTSSAEKWRCRGKIVVVMEKVGEIEKKNGNNVELWDIERRKEGGRR